MSRVSYQTEFVIMVATTRAVFVTEELTNLLPDFFAYLFKNTSYKPSLIFASFYLQALYPWTQKKEFLEEINELENLRKIVNHPTIRNVILKQWILSKKILYGNFLQVPNIASTSYKLLR